jgi:hypothetical protein
MARTHSESTAGRLKILKKFAGCTPEKSLFFSVIETADRNYIRPIWCFRDFLAASVGLYPDYSTRVSLELSIQKIQCRFLMQKKVK